MVGDSPANLRRDITREVIALHKRFYGRGATTGQTYFVHDDLIVVELHDAYTTVEHTLIAKGQTDMVMETRKTFQTAMDAEFTNAVEALTGRNVEAYDSLVFVAPDRLLEVFFLEPTSRRPERLEREEREDRGEAERPIGGLSADDG